MLVVVSPAKRMDETAPRRADGSTPVFLAERDALLATARDLTPKDLEKLMGISSKLADLNVARYKSIGSGEGEKQAVELYAGDTYAGLEAATMDAEALDFAQDHLRILSGLYGLLRPKDMIEPHRMEMGTKLKTPRGKSLYEFWGDQIAEQLNRDAAAAGTDVLINCASVEYFTAADREVLGLRVITPMFYETKKGAPKIVSFFAKKARGAMARFICEGRLTDPEDIKRFDTGGYAYQPEMSAPDRPVFLRPEDAA